MFLVGGPPFLSSTPAPEHGTGEEENTAISQSKRAEETPGSPGNGVPQNWGIMEACRRISAIRSVCDARTKAIRNRPEPARDSETSRSNRIFDTSSMELIGEKSQ
jgi:hypothetical protein